VEKHSTRVTRVAIRRIKRKKGRSQQQWKVALALVEAGVLEIPRNHKGTREPRNKNGSGQKHRGNKRDSTKREGGGRKRVQLVEPRLGTNSPKAKKRRETNLIEKYRLFLELGKKSGRLRRRKEKGHIKRVRRGVTYNLPERG